MWNINTAQYQYKTSGVNDSIMEVNLELFAQQENKHNVIFKAGLRPFIMKNGNQFRGVLEHWEKARAELVQKNIIMCWRHRYVILYSQG